MTDKPTRVDLETPDLAAQKRVIVEELLPGVVADGVVDATRLGELLDLPVTAPSDGRERFGLMWAGKQDAVRSLLTTSKATLVPDVDASSDFDNAQHVFIEGDNLEVLKLLQKAYNDKVKLIYIDPPYNTGSNDFIYPDDFSDTLRAYLEYVGGLDHDGKRTSAKTDTSGRRHSRWLSMMYPRLVLARNVLTQDGLLFVSIDDNEVGHLRLLLDEVFGPENFLGTFVWVSNIKGRQLSGAGPAGTKEYVHAYARNVDEASPFRATASVLKNLMPSVYKGFTYKTETDAFGIYVLKNELHNTNSAFNEQTRPNLVYDIYYDERSGLVRTEALSDTHVHAGFIKISPKRNNNGVHRFHAFRWSRAKVEAESHDLAFVNGPSGWKVYTKVRDVDSTSAKDLLMDISTNAGSADLEAVSIDASWFDYPKPVRLIQVLVDMATDRNSLVLDFFGGSGTTAHAVMAQNSADGGTRRSITVTLPEPVAPTSEPGKAGLATIADVSLMRISNAAASLDAAGLRVFRLAESRFVGDGPLSATDQLSLTATTLRDSEDDVWSIAAEVLLKEGVPLDQAWSEHVVDGAVVEMACGVAVVVGRQLTDSTLAAIFRLEPRVIVLLEDNLAGKDALKANAVTNARNLGITLKTV